VNATKERFGADALPGLLEGATRVVVAKGKKILEFKPAKDDMEDIAKVVIGPSGNLRAPSIKMGKTWLVGFNEEAYAAKFD
jgi:hypothetical protein